MGVAVVVVTVVVVKAPSRGKEPGKARGTGAVTAIKAVHRPLNYTPGLS